MSVDTETLNRIEDWLELGKRCLQPVDPLRLLISQVIAWILRLAKGPSKNNIAKFFRH